MLPPGYGASPLAPSPWVTRRADGHRPALVVVHQILTQRFAVGVVGDGVAELGKALDLVERQPVAQRHHQVVVSRGRGRCAGALARHIVHAPGIHVERGDVTLDEPRANVVQRLQDVHGHGELRVAVLEHLGGNVWDVQQVGLAVDHGDVHAVPRVLADFLRTAQTGEITAQNQNPWLVCTHGVLLK